MTQRRYESYTARLNELHIKDMKFLHGQEMPTLAVLYVICPSHIEKM